MKNFTLTLIIAAALIGFTMSANAQTPSTSEANVVTALTLTNTAPLYFGTFTYDGTASQTLQVAANGTATPTAGIVLIGGAAPTASAFEVTGTAGMDYTVTLPASFTITDGTTPLTVNGITSSLASNTGTIPASGPATFTVGGTLNMVTTAADGNYTGTFNVSVAYN